MMEILAMLWSVGSDSSMGVEVVKIPTGHPGGGSRRKVYEHG